MFRLIVALGALVIVSGCADRLSEDECQAGNWRSIGYRDGVDGLNSGQGQARLDQCARFDVALDLGLYEQGRREGLVRFCTPSGAFDAAMRSTGDIRLCENADFLTIKAFRVATDYIRARRQLDSARSSFDFALRRIDSERYELNRLYRELRKAETEEDRVAIRARISETRSDLDRAYNQVSYERYDLQRAEREFYYAEREYLSVRAEIGAYESSQARDARRDLLDEPLEGGPVRGEPGYPPLIPDEEEESD